MRIRLVAAASLLLLASVAWVGAAQGPGAPPACDATFQDVPGQGHSRRHASGLWEVCLRDGDTVLTHGPDGPAGGHGHGHAAAPGGGGGGGGTPQRAPVCVTSHYRNVLVYAVPSDKADRYSTMAATLRADVEKANAQLYADAQAFGATIDYRFQCTGGVVDVLHHVLPTPSAQDSFSTIVSDLLAQGIGNAYAKFWVWYDDGVGGYCGQGSIWGDTRLTAGNSNNGGNMFALTYGCDWTVLMHENGHNLGAVQLDAPHSSGGWHCNDGRDIMCYADGGSTSNYSPNVCSGTPFDCNHDDYFHPAPGVGSYLATHWNLGSTLNRWFAFGSVTAPPSAPQGLTASDAERVRVAGVYVRNAPVQLSWQAPATLNGGLVQDYEVYRGAQKLASVAGDQFSWSDYTYPASGTYTYTVRAINAAGAGPAASATADVTVVLL